ncbi:MAG: 4Fe-4S dicluster domain-containing protein [bacterium]
MIAVKMKKDNLHHFLNSIKPFGALWGPVSRGDGFVLEKVEDFSLLDLTALRTKIPFKKLLFPPRFSMFHFDGEGIRPSLDDFPNQVLFGLHPCDLHGLMILDRFFTMHYDDPYYLERRKRTAVIGLSCIPDARCFCKTTNTHYAEGGFDLALTDLDDFFIVWVGSSLGDDMIRACPELMEEKISHDDLRTYVEWRQHRESSFTLNMDFAGMPSIMELCWDDPLWEELGEKCLSCGACTVVCPTCPCFNVLDEVELDGRAGQRIRRWDSCMFREYSMVAGGHNFRESRAERLKLRFTHKLQAFVGKFGEPACVGCGRCIDTCPVGIDIKTVGLRLRGEEATVCKR